MPPVRRLDLSPGTVLLIYGYASRGHQPKDKFLFIVGAESELNIKPFQLPALDVALAAQEMRGPRAGNMGA